MTQTSIVTELCTVLLVEDEPDAYARVAAIVEQHPRLTLFSGERTFSAAKSVLERDGDQIDLLLTDLQLGDGDGAALISMWRGKSPTGQRRAMVISVFGDVTSVIRAVEAGADGYLLKSGSDFEMFTSITTVLEGGAPISAAVAGHLLRRVRKESQSIETPLAKPKLPNLLSTREVEVLSALARGRSYKEVARDMNISPHTVGGHVKNIYHKLAVTSRGEAVFKAVQEGMIDMSS